VDTNDLKKIKKIKKIYILNNLLGSTVVDFLVDANGRISCSGKVRIFVNEGSKFFFFSKTSFIPLEV
jgi:hypothetical protein